MQIDCVKGTPKLVGRGVYRKVFRVGEFVLKVEASRGGNKNVKSLRKRAVVADAHQRRIRKELTFLPRYYGTILAGVGDGGAPVPVVITVHEYVEPIRISSINSYSIKTLKALFDLIKRASERGYLLDMKLTNFGRRGGEIVYLDECGIGKGPIPPDVQKHLSEFVQFVQGLFEKVILLHK